jgi:hypothetical protein
LGDSKVKVFVSSNSEFIYCILRAAKTITQLEFPFRFGFGSLCLQIPYLVMYYQCICTSYKGFFAPSVSVTRNASFTFNRSDCFLRHLALHLCPLVLLAGCEVIPPSPAAHSEGRNHIIGMKSLLSESSGRYKQNLKKSIVIPRTQNSSPEQKASFSKISPALIFPPGSGAMA